MANPIASISTRNKVVENCWNYLLENFHKFNEHNKIKVALAVVSKDMPTKLEGADNKNTIYVINGKNGKLEACPTKPIRPALEPAVDSGSPSAV